MALRVDPPLEVEARLRSRESAVTEEGGAVAHHKRHVEELPREIGAASRQGYGCVVLAIVAVMGFLGFVVVAAVIEEEVGIPVALTTVVTGVTGCIVLWVAGLLGGDKKSERKSVRSIRAQAESRSEKEILETLRRSGVVQQWLIEHGDDWEEEDLRKLYARARKHGCCPADEKLIQQEIARLRNK